MEFFSSPSLPKLPFPGEPWGSPELAGPLGTEPPPERGAHQYVWEILGLPVLGYFQEKTGGGALRPCHNGMGRVTHSSGPLFCPLGLLLGRGKRETKWWGVR